MSEEEQGANEQGETPTPEEVDLDITAPDIEYVINTYDPETDANSIIINESKK